MSLKAIKEAVDYLENNPTADEAQDARRRARAEVAALEKAAKTYMEDRPSDKDWDAMYELLATVAKEAE